MITMHVSICLICIIKVVGTEPYVLHGDETCSGSKKDTYAYVNKNDTKTKCANLELAWFGEVRET
jgi:hypothetical protein